MTLTKHHSAIVIAASVMFTLGANMLTGNLAHAALGGTTPPMQARDNAALRVLGDGTVRVRSSVDAGGTTINEYASRDGVVFAYAWQGPTMPDLTQLLGPYAQRYRAKATEQFNESGQLHASRVEQPDVIVESGGQMRSYVGRAWLPAAIPPGVSPNDLR